MERELVAAARAESNQALKGEMARTESETTSQRRRPRAACDREGGEGGARRGAGHGSG